MKGTGSIYGECEKVLPALDLGNFDIIDFDAYGSPYSAMVKMFENKSLKSGTRIFYTFIQTGMGKLENKLLAEIGITKAMLEKAQTIFRKKEGRLLMHSCRGMG